MAINLKFDLLGNPEPPSIVLANRNGNKLGQLNVNVDSIDVSDKFNAASEFSFTLNKYIDGELNPLWDKVKDFKLVYCPEWDLWFEIKVELDESTEIVKTVFCTQLGQAELSQIKVYNIHINEEGDPNWDINNETYKSTILYDPQNTDASLLHRLLKDKAPHYSIVYVDESIQRIQKTFSFDDTSICDAFNEIAEEIGCLFVYNSNSTKGGKPNRTISVYDLQQNCNDCGHRGEFTNKCPKCQSTNIDYGYGEDTTIFVTSDELATEGIQLVTDVDSVKNCFKLEGGDDLMTATIRNCNPNGSDYIWYFSNTLKEDMSDELVAKLESYDEKYKHYYNEHTSQLNADIISRYNELILKYNDYYDTQSTCLNCGTEGYFYEQCSNPSCNSQNILIGKQLQEIPTTIIGYSDLMTSYYNTIDLLLYLESGLMPNVEMSDTSAAEQLSLLTTSALSPVAVNVNNVNIASLATADSAVLSMAKVLIRPTYKVVIKEDSSSLSGLLSDSNGEYKTWTGKFVVTNYSDETDTASHSDDEVPISIRINNATETFIKQKIEKTLNKENTDDYSITGLFAKDYNTFCVELEKYALNPLKSFNEACDTCLSVLTEQGAGNEDEDKDLYDALYKPYFDKQQAINAEIKNRQDEIAIIEGVWDKSDENNPECITWGLQQYIEKCQQDIQEELDFERYLGEDLWSEFCAYRREDKYSNSNYISDGLNNAELFDRALEFIEVAEEEIFKSAELQHSISATLNNLLSLDKFKPLLKSFKTGNWIRVQVDDKVYKLRLLEYGFGYGDSQSISVEFSDVTKIKNGVTDVKKVLEQASSIASSYDSVQRQAEKGNVARSTIDQWLVDGLNAANMQITNNDNEEVLLTKNGLLARSYDDITGTYSPEQLKITHNIMAYTDDNWRTVRQAIGKQEHKIYDKEQEDFIDTTGYGMNADFVTAGVVSGSQIIGGDIYSENYIGSIDKETGKIISSQGSYIDLKDGKFSFAGGRLAYDGGDLTIVGKIEVTTSGKIGCWDINENSIYKGSSNFYNANGMYFGEQGLSLGNQFKVEPNGIATMTNANVSGTITGSQIIGRNFIFVGKADKNQDGIYIKDYNEDYAEITEDGKLTCTNVDILGGVLKIGRYQILDENNEPELDENNNPMYGWNTWIDENGILKTNESVISGTVYAGAGSIGGFTIESVKDENGDIVGGWLYNSDKTFGTDKSIFLSTVDMSGTISKTTLNNWRLTVGKHFGIASDGTAYMSNCEITGGSLRMGNVNNDYSAWISVDDGVLNANGANITGEIHVSDKSTIAGFTIDGQKIYSGTFGLDNSIYLSTVNMNGVNGFFNGTNTNNWRMTIGSGFGVTGNGILYANNANIHGKITAVDGVIGGLTIKKEEGAHDQNSSVRSVTTGTLEFNDDMGNVCYVGTSQVTMPGDIINVSCANPNMSASFSGNILTLYAQANTPNTVVSGVVYVTYVAGTMYTLACDDDSFALHIKGGTSDFACNKVRMSNIDADKLTATKIITSTGIFDDISAGNISVASTVLQCGYNKLNLSYMAGNEQEYTATISYSQLQQTITVNLDAPLKEQKTFLIRYSVTWGSSYQTCSVTIPQNRSSGSITISTFWGIDYAKFVSNGSYLDTLTFKQGNSTSNAYMSVNAHFLPETNGITTLGMDTHRWKEIWCTQSSINSTSDRNEKNSIECLSDKYGVFFDKLQPVRYKFNQNESNRYHVGFIAQDVADALNIAEIPTSDFAGYLAYEKENGSMGYGLRYSEFIALNTYEIQQLKKRVKELEIKLETLNK